MKQIIVKVSKKLRKKTNNNNNDNDKINSKIIENIITVPNFIPGIKLFNNIKKKKICLVGNRPLNNNYGKIIDLYDVVIRFNSGDLLKINDISKYGEKTTYLLINFPIFCKFIKNMNINYLNEFNQSFQKDLKKNIVDNEKKLIIRANKKYYSSKYNILDIGKFNKVSEFDRNLIENINNKFNLNLDPYPSGRLHLTCGLALIMIMLLNDMDINIIGFSKITDLLNYTVYSDKYKNNKTIIKETSVNHNYKKEREMIYELYKNNIINIIDIKES